MLSGWLAAPVMAAPAAEAYLHESWSVRDGLPVNSISEMLQSRSGYLWLGTFDGLVRFDGSAFRTYNSSNTPGFAHNRLRDVRETRSGLLLLASEVGTLQAFDPATAQVRHLWTVPTGRELRTWAAPDGSVWASLQPGLGRVEDDQLEVLTVAPLPELQVEAMGFSGATIWLAAVDAGIWRWQAGQLQAVASAAQVDVGHVHALATAADGTLWVGGEAGVVLVGPAGARRLRDGDQDWLQTTIGFAPDGAGGLLVGSENGVHEYRDGRLHQVDPADPRRAPQQDQATAGDPSWRISASAVFRTGGPAPALQLRLPDLEATRITQGLLDHNGSLWLGTSGAGLHRLRPVPFRALSEAQGLSAREVYPLHQDAHGAIWIGTQKGGLNRYADGLVASFGAGAGLRDDNIRAIAHDAAGTLWVATYEAGLFRQAEAGNFVAATSPGPAQARIGSLFLDREDRFWAGTDAGLYQRTGDAWVRHPGSDAVAGCSVRAIREAPDDVLWLATNRCGALRLAPTPERYDARSGASDFIRDVLPLPGGIVWLASEDRGIARMRWPDGPARPPRSVSIRAAHGLLSDGVHAILADRGWFWMSSNHGIFRVRQQELDAAADALERGETPAPLAIDVYRESAGLRNREANGGVQTAALRSTTGQLWFATQDGVAVVDPASPLLAPAVRPAIDRVRSGDRQWPAGAPLTLAAAERSFSVEFAELRQLDPDQARLRYRLVGHDDDWIEAGARRGADYSRVPPGAYEFALQAWSGGAWVAPGARLALTVQPFPSETAGFKVLLGGIALLLMWLGFRARVGWLEAQRRQLQRQVDARTEELARGKASAEQASLLIAAQAEQLRELDRQKSRFFDDLAHELRTPLTLILGPLKDIRDARLANPQPAIDGAIRNGEVLLDLTNQLLDLARLEAGKLGLERRPEDLVALLRASAERFQPLARSRGIGFHWRAPGEALVVSLDRRHAGKIVDNLLSNAFKFTPPGGRVELSVAATADGHARIEVADTGPGIAAEHLAHVFERFFHSDGADARLQPGTGIGLALVHDLTRLHDGRLVVRSAPGEGTVFEVLLPLAPGTALPAGDRAEELSAAVMPAPDAAGAGAEDGDPDRTTVLVVDDHAEIRAHVRAQLAPAYRVLEAGDGLAALALARERLPDLVVADISMPGLDGYELCAQIRGDAELEGLPVILLTARAGLDHRLEGLRAAADDYLTKPFEGAELRARVDNLIAMRRRLRERFAQAGECARRAVAEVAVAAAGDDDAGYRARLIATIRAHMADEDFKVSDLADAMRQDRSHLFRRVRECTGQAPSDLIRELRLERAAELLRERAGPIGEIAYAVGFGSVAYFTKCFRERFARTPGQYRGEREVVAS